MGVANRIAWQKINEMETRLGQSLVASQALARSASERASPLGRTLVERLTRFARETQAEVTARYEETFQDTFPEHPPAAPATEPPRDSGSS